MIIIFLGLVLRIIISSLNIELDFYYSLPDALKFHEQGLNYSHYLENKELILTEYKYSLDKSYGMFLGLIYNYFSESYLLGSYLSCFTWCLSAYFFRLSLIKVQSNSTIINISTFCYTFLFPTSIIYTSITLREAYLLLLFNLKLFFLINFENLKNKISKIFYIILITLFIILLCLFHRANIVLFIIIIPLSLILLIFLKFNIKKIFIFFFSLIGMYLLFKIGIIEKIFNIIHSYQRGHFSDQYSFRTDFYEKDYINNLTYSAQTSIFHFSQNLFNYFFQPTIFKINNLLDMILFFENMFRFVLILICLRKLFKKIKRKEFYYLFFLYFIAMEIIYSQATVNWGTASRHHVPMMGILIILSCFSLKEYKKK